MLKTIRNTALGLVFVMAAAGSLSASEIYKWTDEDGNVHYSDRPTSSASTERLAIRSGPTDPENVQVEVQARVDAQAERVEQQASEQSQGLEPEEQRTEVVDREAQCARYREREFRRRASPRDRRGCSGFHTRG